MSKPPQDTRPENWQRFFAASANNRAWQLAELPIDRVDARELLNAAHAAAWHWQAIGTELHNMRALMLLAQAHALAGLGPSAWAYANEMRAYFVAAAATPDWELAFTHAICAQAAFAAGDAAEHRRSYALAASAVAAVADAEDREIVVRLFANVPAP